MNREAEKHFNTGNEYGAKGDHPSAVEEFKNAIEEDATDPRYWISYGVCLMVLKQWDEAIEKLEAGINLKPAYAEADARLYLAEALLKAGRKSDAIKQLEFISRMEPSYPGYEKPIEEAITKLEQIS
ncbi:MAG: tetratricopeptide repeat protein [Acidiferrobacterales bacterium]